MQCILEMLNRRDQQLLPELIQVQHTSANSISLHPCASIISQLIWDHAYGIQLHSNENSAPEQIRLRQHGTTTASILWALQKMTLVTNASLC